MSQFLKIVGFVEQAFKKRFEDIDAPLNITYEPDALDGAVDAFVIENQLNLGDMVILFLALLPRIDPSALQSILLEHSSAKSDAAYVGGLRGKNHRGILPNGELALFLLAGKNYEARLSFQNLFSPRNFLFDNEVLKFVSAEMSEPPLSAALVVNADWYNETVLGEKFHPKLSADFPAQLIETRLDWEDLVVAPKTLDAIDEIKLWLEHNDTLMHQFEMNRHVKPGYRALFFGPPGVGKTMAVMLLGKHVKRPVYRVDLSMVVSKYIGETEKNLSSLFNKAEHKDWILFFDEADAIFGKRTQVKDAHDKYANQEVSYLLQKVESFNGLVILASNFKSNVDSAFARRFQSFVEFEMPSVEQRHELWQKMLPPQMQLESLCDLNYLSQKYQVTGANIINSVQFAAVKALSRSSKSPIILQEDLIKGIIKELKKEGKV